MRSLLVRLLLVFGLTQALWLMYSPILPVQAGGLVTNCADDGQFSSLLAGGGNITFDCGTALPDRWVRPAISAPWNIGRSYPGFICP